MEKLLQKIKTLAGHEKVSKALIAELSREVLTYVMIDDGTGKASEDSQVMNRLLEVLTPVNKRACYEFFQVFAGFLTDAESKTFNKKDKARFGEKQKKAKEFLDDPLNNVWTWSTRELVIEAKPFDFESIKSQMGVLLKKAKKNGMDDSHVIKALLANGVSVNDVMTVLQAIE